MGAVAVIGNAGTAPNSEFGRQSLWRSGRTSWRSVQLHRQSTCHINDADGFYIPISNELLTWLRHVVGRATGSDCAIYQNQA